MSKCIFCKRHVWRWQRAQDPAGNMRSDVHKTCREVSDRASELAYDHANKLNTIIGAPTIDELSRLFDCSYSMTMTQFENARIRLRNKYGKSYYAWTLRNI